MTSKKKRGRPAKTVSLPVEDVTLTPSGDNMWQ